jgi:hypothetical protein
MPDINLIPKKYKGSEETVSAIFSKIRGIILILIILGLLLSGGLLFYKKDLNKKIDSVKKDIAAIDAKRDSEKETSIIDFDKKISTLKGLVANHFYWSQFYLKLEELTVPNIYFYDIKISYAEEKISVALSANASNYIGVARQMLSFQEEPLIEKVEIAGISLSAEGGIKFNFSITFSKKALLKAND